MPLPAFVRLPTAAEAVEVRSLIAPLKVVEALFVPTVSRVAVLVAALPSTTTEDPLPASEPIDGAALTKSKVAAPNDGKRTTGPLLSAKLSAATSVPPLTVVPPA